MPSLLRELEVVRSVFLPKHDPVEAVMVFKLFKYRQAEAIAVKPQKFTEVIAGSRDPKRRSVHKFAPSLLPQHLG
jgi:hypothetical protein